MKPKQIFEQHAKKHYGESFDSTIFEKAIQKMKRWAANAYGTPSLQELLGECGPEAIETYYNETKAQPDGIQTSNRANYMNRRREVVR